MKVALLLAIFAGVSNVNSYFVTRYANPTYGVHLVQKRKATESTNDADDDDDDMTPKWIGEPFFPACQDHCNFLEYCLSDELDPDNKLHPHCKGYPMLEVPPEECLTCMVKTGFIMPAGMTIKTAKGKCICRRVQTTITIVQGDTCPMDENQKPLCDLNDPKADVTTTDESECGCGENAPTGDKKDDADKQEEASNDNAAEAPADAAEEPAADAAEGEVADETPPE